MSADINSEDGSVGDQTIEQFLWQNRQRYYRLAYAYVRNEADALDIVSDAIVKALENRRTLKDTASIRTWFYRIVVRTAIDALRHGRRLDYVAEVPEPLQSDVYADLELRRALAALPDKYRMVVILRYLEDLPLEEVAAVLNQNLSTVKSRLYKALALLKTAMTTQHTAAGGRPEQWTTIS